MKVYLSSDDTGGYTASDERVFKDDREIELTETEFNQYKQDVQNYYRWQTLFDDKIRVLWYDEMKQRKPDYSEPF